MRPSASGRRTAEVSQRSCRSNRDECIIGFGVRKILKRGLKRSESSLQRLTRETPDRVSLACGAQMGG